MVVEAEGRIIPYGFTEQDVIVNLGEFRGEFPKGYTPAVCLILCCAIMCWVFSAAADIMRVNEIFVSVTMPYC